MNFLVPRIGNVYHWLCFQSIFSDSLGSNPFSWTFNKFAILRGSFLYLRLILRLQLQLVRGLNYMVAWWLKQFQYHGFEPAQCNPNLSLSNWPTGCSRRVLAWASIIQTFLSSSLSIPNASSNKQKTRSRIADLSSNQPK